MGKRIEVRAVNAALALAAACLVVSGCAGLSSGVADKSASAQLLPTLGNQANGSVSFVERSDGAQVSYSIAGLPPNSDHALQVHTRNDCNSGDGSGAGPVFAPGIERLKQGARVEGDLGNIHADANGVATGFLVAPDLALDGPRSVRRRAVLVHRDATDPYAYPPRGVGPALACGPIR